VTIQDYYRQGFAKIDAPRLFKMIQNVLKRARAIVVYNQFFKDFFVSNFGIAAEKIRIVKNPVFKREDASGELDANPTVIFAGRFVSYKNLPLVLRAWSNVRARLGQGRLLLVGDGPEKEALLSLKSELKSGDSIEFRDKLAQAELFEEIKKSAFALAPALNEFNPNFILEALSFGKPAIISQGNGLSVELPNEMLFDPFNQSELEAKMEALLDPTKYKEAVGKIRELKMEQSWKDVTDFHLNLIKEICKR
jgi:glycosyltransferase involved in cell wall biosynthesis